MSTKPLRITRVIEDLLDILMAASPDDPAWGLRLCEQTGLGTGTVYPALDRLLKAGWVEAWWQDPPPADRPPRRYYAITSAGRTAYQEETTARATRRAAWATPVLRVRGTA